MAHSQSFWQEKAGIRERGGGGAKGSGVGMQQSGCKRQGLSSFILWKRGALCPADYDTEDVESRRVAVNKTAPLSSTCAVTAGNTLLTSETRFMVSAPIQASKVPRTERPIWLKRSTGASLFCWPGVTKSRCDWEDAECRSRRATSIIRTTLNRCLPHGEPLPEPAMAGSARVQKHGICKGPNRERNPLSWE